MAAIARTGAVLFGLYLLTIAGLKWAGGHDPEFALPLWAFHAAAVVEVGLGLACCTRRFHRIGLAGGVLLFAGASAWAAWRGASSGSCGCMGRAIALLWREQLLVALISGAVASAVLACAAAVRPPAAQARQQLGGEGA